MEYERLTKRNCAGYWETSTLREKLMEVIGDYIDTSALVPFDRDLTTDDGLTHYGHCSDSVSMLTCDEYRKYRKYIPETNKWYWTITSTTTRDCFVRTVDSVGSLNYIYAYICVGGVRPLICFDKDTFVEVQNAEDKG